MLEIIAMDAKPFNYTYTQLTMRNAHVKGIEVNVFPVINKVEHFIHLTKTLYKNFTTICQYIFKIYINIYFNHYRDYAKE